MLTLTFYLCIFTETCTRLRIPESAEITDLRHVCLRIGLLTTKRCIGVALIRLGLHVASPTRL